MSRSIWIISELFFPNESATAYILTEMAKAFTSEFEVNVVCADTDYENDTNRISQERGLNTIPGINIVRVKVPEFNKNSLPKRLLRVFFVSRILYKQASKRIRPGDVVFAVTNPALLLLFLKRLKQKEDIEYDLLVHDIFPDNALASGVMRRTPLYSLLLKSFDKAYSAADKVLVLGEDMKAIISSKIGHSDNIHVIENWGEDSIKPLERPSDGRLLLQYAGNLGRVQGLDILLSIISGLSNNNLLFDIWGSGAMVPYINHFVSDTPIANLRIRGSYHRDNQNEVLNDCDIAIITLGKGMKGLGVPSKTYNIMASGKPILYIGDKGSEVFNLVKDNNLGFAFDWDETDALIEWLNKLTIKDLDILRQMGQRSRALYESRYTKECLLKKTMEVLSI